MGWPGMNSVPSGTVTSATKCALLVHGPGGVGLGVPVAREMAGVPFSASVAAVSSVGVGSSVSVGIGVLVMTGSTGAVGEAANPAASVAALAQARVVIGEERAALGDDFQGGADVDQVADLGDALVVHDVELGLAEGRGDLVLGHAHAGAGAGHVRALFNGLDAAHVQPDR